MKKLIVIPILLSALLLQGCYLLKQGVSMLNYYGGAQDIDAALERGDLNLEERQTLLLVKDIRAFASGELGLASNGNYTRYKRVDKPYLVDVVSACRPARFEAYIWRFPLFGSFPYKGYFNPSGARRLAGRLQRKGYEVTVRQVQAFSTLGLLKDPVFSFMTSTSELSLAYTIIHEQTHATLFVKDQVEFNEQLATFVGREGALLYLEQKYGDESAVFQEARERLQDQERFIELMQGLYRDLDEVYRSAVPEQEKLAAKKRIIKAFREDVLRNHDRYFDTGTYREFIAKEEINNALILLYMQYTNDLSRFERMYEKHGRDLPEMIQALVSQYGERNESSP